MYWSKSVERSHLENGVTFAHGSARLNLAPADLTTFVDPPDAALMFGFRALTPGDSFESSFAIWMATLRRREGNDAIVESLQRIFPNLVDGDSLVELLRGIASHAQSLGYEKVWLPSSLYQEALLAPSLKTVTDELGQPMIVVPTSGMTAMVLPPPKPKRTADEARLHAVAQIWVEYQKAFAESRDQYWQRSRGNVKSWVAQAFALAARALQGMAPFAGEPAKAYVDRVAAHVRQSRGKGPDGDDESWFDGAIDEAARIISSAT